RVAPPQLPCPRRVAGIGIEDVDLFPPHLLDLLGQRADLPLLRLVGRRHCQRQQRAMRSSTAWTLEPRRRLCLSTPARCPLSTVERSVRLPIIAARGYAFLPPPRG